LQFRNFTYFPRLQFKSLDEKKREFGVVVLRGTFEIHNGKALHLSQKQEPLVLADEYHGKIGESSLRLENNLAPYKLRTDIHVNAVAHAPGEKYLQQWEAGIKVGKIQKKILVTGPRQWRFNSVTGWELTVPRPCIEVPIRYEYAFGGIWEYEKEKKICEENPVGIGFSDKALSDTKHPIAAPQITSPENPVKEFGKSYKPEGFGSISSAWKPRLNFAGTYDERWKKFRSPYLPDDFKFEFYNSAHPGLIYPGFVRGDETVVLINMNPDSYLSFKLPDYSLSLLVRWEDGQMAPLPIMLDTIHIEVPGKKVYLTWRGIFPLVKPIRVLEARIKIPDSVKQTSSNGEDISNGR